MPSKYLDRRDACEPEPEPAGTLDDALGLASQLIDELRSVNVSGLASTRIRSKYYLALGHAIQITRKLGEAIAADNALHPEENDMAETAQQPVDHNTPFYVIIEFTKPVTEQLLHHIVDTCDDAYSEDASAELSNTIKAAHRATYDGFGHHVTVKPVLGNDPNYTE